MLPHTNQAALMRPLKITLQYKTHIKLTAVKFHLKSKHWSDTGMFSCNFS